MARLSDLDAACSQVLRRSLSPSLKASLWSLVYTGRYRGEILRLVERGGAKRYSLTWLACSYELDDAEAAWQRGDPLPPQLFQETPPADGPSSAGA